MKRLYNNGRGPDTLFEFSYIGEAPRRFQELRTRSLVDMIGMKNDLLNCLYG